MDDLIELNRLGLENKINQLEQCDGLYPANDLIDVLSDAKERDKRYINNFTSDELVTKSVKRGKFTRTVRYFTEQGLVRYIHEGKLFSYANVCKIFNIQAINKNAGEWQKLLDKSMNASGEYKVSIVLKWIFGKRKACASLGEYATKEEIVNFAEEFDTADKDKIKFIS